MCSSVDYKIKKNQDQRLAMTWAVAIVQLETMPLIVITIRKQLKHWWQFLSYPLDLQKTRKQILKKKSKFDAFTAGNAKRFSMEIFQEINLNRINLNRIT